MADPVIHFEIIGTDAAGLQKSTPTCSAGTSTPITR